MKKIRYNSFIAKLLWSEYNTITLAAWVCTKYKNKEEMPQRIRNHECTHARQWVERCHQSVDVVEMQTRGRLVEDEHRRALLLLTEEIS